MQGNNLLCCSAFQLCASQCSPRHTDPFLLSQPDGDVTVGLSGFASAAPSPPTVKLSP